MDAIKRVAAINDLSGASRCSLTVALPIISAMGIQCMVMPTAILSNHTGYDKFFFDDYSGKMDFFTDNWKNMGIKFDAIYSGFLGSHGQIKSLIDFIDSFKTKTTKIIIDPVMGDNGEIYSTYTKEMCDDMKKLVSRADIITPNITEACILSGTDYDGETLPEAKLIAMAEKISKLGAKNIIITGHRSKNKVSNFVYSGGVYKSISTKLVPMYYSGTGDVFASLITGLSTLGFNVFDSAIMAADFVMEATELSFSLGLDIKDGICFEKLMGKICAMKGSLK